MNTSFKICTAKCYAGLEEVLANELHELGFDKIQKRRRAVEFQSDLDGLMRANLELRTALSILYPLSDFHIKSNEDLYKGAFAIPWEELFDAHLTFSIQHTVFTDLFQNTTYPAMILKDAIVDRFRNKGGRRPSVNRELPDINIHLYISADHVVISVNTSGNSLFMRGYRNMAFPAPLNECLAAGLVLLSGWTPGENLINPMCGSGTLVVEAAMMAHKIPANWLREQYCFMNLKSYNHEKWLETRKTAEKKCKSKVSGVLQASDASRRAVSITRNSLQLIGLEDSVSLFPMDLKRPKVDTEEGTVLLNPPYGERIQEEDLNELYALIGKALKFEYQGHRAWIISSNMEALNQIGLKPFKKYDVFNGKLPCKYQGYELFSGKHKEYKAS